MKNKLLLQIACLLAALALLPRTSTAQPLRPLEAEGNPSYVQGELIIQFKPTVTSDEVSEIYRQASLRFMQHVKTPAMSAHGHFGLTHVQTAIPVASALAILKNFPAIEFAEPNWVYSQQADSNDPFYLDGTLWGMYGDDSSTPIGPPTTTNPFGSQAEKAWASGITGSKQICIGVVEGGFQFDHQDLADNVWTNPGEIAGNGVDEDGNGYPDDIHGWNAINDNGNTYDPLNDSHGTHVSGTLAAVGGNGVGVAGVNWNATLISGRFILGNSGGSLLNAVKAIDYITSLKTRKGLNIVAINASWGGGSFSQALLDSITRAAKANILFVAAAMNSSTNLDLTPVYPASYDTTAGAGYNSVIAVAAIDKNGNLASFSNYGQKSVHLGAPGVAVYSTLPTNSYGSYNGTSMATPHVTGAIALYASSHPAANAAMIRNDLLTYGVTPTPSLNGFTTTGGRLDLSRFIFLPAATVAAPNAPGNLTLTADPTGPVLLNWVDQSGDELGFAVERSTDGVTYTLVDTIGANYTSFTDRTVRPATTYYYRIRAFNPGGNSAYAFSASFVTSAAVSVPTAPGNLSATAYAGAGIKLSWVDNSNNETGFQLERQTSGATAWVLLGNLAANTVTYTDTTTVARTTYTYRVRAYNTAGSSSYSNQVSARAK